MTRKEVLLTKAAAYLSAGLNVIAVDNQKRALYPWAAYSLDKITLKALAEQLDNERAEGLAIITGAVSEGLEVIDFDLKHDISGNLMERFYALIPQKLKDKLLIHSTRSNGFHLLYRCEVIEGNKKLASRPPTAQELIDTPHLKMLTIIETRGEKGYVVAPPSAGYNVEQANDVPRISIDERDILLDAARSFMEVHVEERARFTPTGTPFVLSPFDDYNAKGNTVQLLLEHGWTIVSEDKDKVYLLRPGTTTAANSGNYHKAKRLFYVWTTSTQFYPEKAYSPVAVYTTLVHGGDFSKASKQLISDNYGTKKTAENVAKTLKKPFEFDGKFWEVVPGKKDTVKIEVSLTKLVSFINIKGGFTGYKYNETSENILVQVRDGFVKEVELYDIKQFLKNEILSFNDTFDTITPDELLEVVYREYLSYLSKGFMDFLTVTPLEFLKDTKDSAFFPFRNGIVEVTREGCKLHKYGEFKKVIWASQMIDAHITLQDTASPKFDFTNIDFCKFIRQACGNTDDRFEYFVTILGYLLHKYKDPKNAFAVILAEETENEAEGGGTGKGLFVKGIQQLIPTEIFDGKQFKASKSFCFQRVSLDTKLIAIEDAHRRFNFESIYSFITEGLPVEKKNQKEFYIPFCDSPKITISTNYAISDEGNHAKRRQKVLEFSNFFSPANTPYDYLKRMMFSEDWDSDEWNRFYNFMFFACRIYLEVGVTDSVQSDTNKIKNIKMKYSDDLLLFFETVLEELKDYQSIKEMYGKFLEHSDLKPLDYPKDKFAKGVRYISDTLGHKFEETQKRVGGRVCRVFRINNDGTEPATKSAENEQHPELF